VVVASQEAQPARKRSRIADRIEVRDQLQPDTLPGVLGVGAVQPMATADGPDERGEAFDHGVPRLPIAILGPPQQRIRFLGHDR
jgi:hypothetical protein